MSLHNNEYHAMCELRRQIKQLVENIINTSETYKRIQSYIKLANDNSEIVAKKVENNNSLCYEGITNIHAVFNMESLLTSSYEIHLCIYKEKKLYKSVSIGIDSFIVLLSECGLVDDTECDLTEE